MSHKIHITGRFARERVKALIDRIPDGWVARFSPLTRTEEQNKKLWPMIEDLRQQVPGMAEFTKDEVKLRLLNALGHEMKFLPALEGAGMFPVGLRSSTLTKEQFSLLIELIYEFGARHGVQWTDPAEKAA